MPAGPGSSLRLLVACAAVAWGGKASAHDAPRDWFLNPPPEGTFVTTDLSTGGPQVGIERRDSIAEEAGMTVLRGSTLAGVGYGEGALLGDARFLFFTAGVTAGYRQVWRTYAPPAGTRVSRQYRLDIDKDKASTSRGWFFGEARLRLALPMDDLVLVANHAVRHEGTQENSYDWFHSTVHDGGVLFRFDATLFFRSPSRGGGAAGALPRPAPRRRARRRVGLRPRRRHEAGLRQHRQPRRAAAPGADAARRPELWHPPAASAGVRAAGLPGHLRALTG